MKFSRVIVLATLLFAAGNVLGQFDGPAPLAWRWSASTVLVPNGNLTTDGQNVYLAMGDRVYSVNAKSGNETWRYPKGVPDQGFFHRMPILANGMIVTMNEKQYAIALDANTGELKWQHFIAKPILNQPVSVGKYVVFEVSDNTLLVLDSRTGDQVGSPLRISKGISSAAVGFQDLVILFTGGADLAAYNVALQDTASGASPGTAASSVDSNGDAKPAWVTKFETTGSSSTPVLYGDTVYVNSGNYVAAVRAYTGSGKWQRNLDQSMSYPPAIFGDTIAEVTAEGRLVSLDLRGNQLFPEPLELLNYPQTEPTPLGDYIAVMGGNGSVNLINSRSGKSVWSFVMKPIAKIREAGGRGQAGNPARGGRGSATGTSASTATGSFIDFVTASAPAVLIGDTLVVLAKDGSLLGFNKAEGVDLTPPDADMVLPHPGDQVSGQPPLTFAFTLNDEASGVNEDSVSINLDGKPVDFEKTREHYYLVRVSTEGKVKPLADGHHTLTVHATDWMGNAGATTFSITVDNSLPPQILPGQVPAGSGRGGAGAGGGNQDPRHRGGR